MSVHAQAVAAHPVCVDLDSEITRLMIAMAPTVRAMRVVHAPA